MMISSYFFKKIKILDTFKNNSCDDGIILVSSNGCKN